MVFSSPPKSKRALKCIAMLSASWPMLMAKLQRGRGTQGSREGNEKGGSDGWNINLYLSTNHRLLPYQMWQQLMQLSGNIFTEFSQENLRVAVVFGLDADLELMPLLECHVPDFLGKKKKGSRKWQRGNEGRWFEYMDGWVTFRASRWLLILLTSELTYEFIMIICKAYCLFGFRTT